MMLITFTITFTITNHHQPWVSENFWIRLDWRWWMLMVDDDGDDDDDDDG